MTLSNISSRSRLKELGWFVAIGASNTVLTYAVYLIALQFTWYITAYVVSFLFGVIYTALLNIRLAFSTPLNPHVLVAHIACGTIYFLLNLFLLHIAVERLAVSEALAPILVLVITFPIYFTAARTAVAYTGKPKALT